MAALMLSSTARRVTPPKTFQAESSPSTCRLRPEPTALLRDLGCDHIGVWGRAQDDATCPFGLAETQRRN